MAQVRTVGIVGAGVSGVATAVHLKAAGFQVTVFERSAVAGGVWVFDERKPPEPPYPSTKPSKADFTAFTEPDFLYEDLWHGPPGPCYEGLCNNVPTPLLEMKVNSWKSGTPDIVSHSVLKDYIQETAERYNIHDCTLYNTRVEDVSKQNKKWRVATSTLNVSDLKKYTNSWEFDYFVVASGHYHACRIPDIPGLKELKRLRPHFVHHSKSYRRAEDYKDKTILLVGAGVSSMDIAKEVSSVAKRVYQSSRGGLFDLSAEMLPSNVERIGGVSSFNLEDSTHSFPSPPSTPGSYSNTIAEKSNTISLVDGSLLSGIDCVILCTGYLHTLPFLADYHRDSFTADGADDTCLVTDGTQFHNLHEDIFYIPDPSLAFIGVPYYTATFSLFEFQAIALAKVWTGDVRMPDRDEMSDTYREKVQRLGTGRSFHSLLGKEEEYVQELLRWVNTDTPKDRQITGHSEAWRKKREELVSQRKVVLEQASKRKLWQGNTAGIDEGQ